MDKRSRHICTGAGAVAGGDERVQQLEGLDGQGLGGARGLAQSPAFTQQQRWARDHERFKAQAFKRLLDLALGLVSCRLGFRHALLGLGDGLLCLGYVLVADDDDAGDAGERGVVGRATTGSSPVDDGRATGIPEEDSAASGRARRFTTVGRMRSSITSGDFCRSRWRLRRSTISGSTALM